MLTATAGFGNIGGIIATYSFLQSDQANFYRKGYTICLAFISFAAASAIAYAVAITWENRKKEKAIRSQTLTISEKTELGVSGNKVLRLLALANVRCQDLNPEFRYML